MDFSVDIFCRVVDNFGDAGVVLRLAKGLAAAAPSLDLRLVVDDLGTLQKLRPGIDPAAPVQKLGAWTLVRWDHPWEGFARRPARLVIESLACGKPEHYDRVLYDPAGTEVVLHVNLEYLSAEAYPEDFHLVPSLSPLKRVQKYFFLPGFTPKTGGLVLDPDFMEKKRFWDASARRAEERRRKAASWGLDLPRGTEAAAWVLLFAYEQDFGALVRALFRWERPKLVLLAEGASRRCFLDAWEKAGRPFPVLPLPFLSQETWDDLLLACDLALVRGEESLSRAALGGRPFLWQAYRQEAGYQRVKVGALLDRLQPFFGDAAVFGEVRGAFELYNAEDSGERDEEPYPRFFRGFAETGPGYRAFARSLEANGDLAEHLLEFLQKLPGVALPPENGNL